MTNEAGMPSEAQELYPRITRRTLHEEVLERLRDMIIELRDKVGSAGAAKKKATKSKRK